MAAVFRVDDVFTLPERGTVAMGEVTKGSLAIGDEVSIGASGRTATVIGMDLGAHIGVVLKGVSRDEVAGCGELWTTS